MSFVSVKGQDKRGLIVNIFRTTRLTLLYMHTPQELVVNQIQSNPKYLNIYLPKYSECIPSTMGHTIIYHTVLYHFRVMGRIYYYSLLSASFSLLFTFYGWWLSWHQ